jgi:hypothetical protein
MQQSLVKEFSKTAAQAHEAFPDALAMLVVLLVSDTDTPVFVAPIAAEKLTKNTMTLQAAIRKVAQQIVETNSTGIASAHYALANTIVSLIALDNRYTDNYPQNFTKEMDAIFTLDHEIGHLIITKGPSPNEHLSECAADAFATLRHIQRFGKSTDILEYLRDKTVQGAIFDTEIAHYTTDAIELASKEADKMGNRFFELSLRETAILAAKIADEARLAKEALINIQSAYQPIAEHHQTHGRIDADTVRSIIDVMNEHRNDPDVIKIGKRFLNARRLQAFIKKSAAADTSGYWKQALAFLNTHKTETSQQPPRSTTPGMKP